MPKRGNRFTSYLLFFALAALLMSGLQNMVAGKAPDYSQIRGYFNEEQVEYFVLEGSELTITLKKG